MLGNIRSLYYSILGYSTIIKYLPDGRFKLTDHHSNGTKFCEWHLLEYCLHGKYTEWSLNQNKVLETHYSHGLQHGSSWEDVSEGLSPRALCRCMYWHDKLIISYRPGIKKYYSGVKK